MQEPSKLKEFRLWRPIKKGEFIIVAGDCSQGGDDANTSAFLSHTNLDFPITYKRQGVANDMTDDIFPVLEWLYDLTGLPPVVAFERNNGGASEMDRLNKLNLKKKYTVYVMKLKGNTDDAADESKKLGFITDSSTRPALIKDWKYAFDNRLVKLYDPDFIEEHRTFITNYNGKPVAAKGFHDDCVISPAIAWQLYQTEEVPRPAITHTEFPDDNLFNKGFY